MAAEVASWGRKDPDIGFGTSPQGLDSSRAIASHVLQAASARASEPGLLDKPASAQTWGTEPGPAL